MTLGLAAVAGGLAIAAWHRHLLAWSTLLGAVIAVVLFVPIRRYSIGAGLPIELEPYRVLIAAVLFGWLLALLGDPRTRWRRTGLEAPLLGFAACAVASLALNAGRIGAAGIAGPVVKGVAFFASFVAIMYFVAGVVTRWRDLDRTLMLLVAGATVVSVSSIVEWRTGFNAFDHLERLVPIFHFEPNTSVDAPMRGARTRAFGSAQHPIALSAALVLLVPVALYLHRRRAQLAWLAAAGLLVLGALATGSRTAVPMLLAELAVFLWVKRAETVRLLPLLLPLLVAAQVMVPGALGTLRATLFPEQGLVGEQQGGHGSGTGRIADIGPALEELSRTPLLGQGFATRLTSVTDVKVNAPILDNEWLGILLEVGVLGALFLLWLYVRAIRRLARASRADRGDRGWALAALAASTAAFAVGMLTYDAFSFIQVTLLSFMLLGVGAVALRERPPVTLPSP